MTGDATINSTKPLLQAVDSASTCDLHSMLPVVAIPPVPTRCDGGHDSDTDVHLGPGDQLFDGDMEALEKDCSCFVVVKMTMAQM